MTWHLKNRKLEKKLNELVDGDQFTEALNRECLYPQNKNIIVVKFGKNCGHIKGSFCCYFQKDDIINIGYDPKAWNKYHEVTPPYGVMMRIKMKNGYLRAGYLKKFSDGDCWVNPNGFLMSKAENDEIELFRPWED